MLWSAEVTIKFFFSFFTLNWNIYSAEEQCETLRKKADTVGNTETTNEFDCTATTWFICLRPSSSSICRYHLPSVYSALSAAFLITVKAAKYLERFSNAFWQISWNAASLMDRKAFDWGLQPNAWVQLWTSLIPVIRWRLLLLLTISAVHHHHRAARWKNMLFFFI